jgi:hypothetical protein
MPSSVSYSLVTVQTSYDPDFPTGPNQYAYLLSSGTISRAQYQDNVYVKDDGTPVAVPSGFNFADLSSSAVFIYQDTSNYIGVGSLCLANPSGTGGNLAVFDFSTGNAYTYAAPSGWLVSAAAWGGSYLYWAEASMTVGSGPSITVRVRRSDGMFTRVSTLATYQYYPYPATVTTVVRPISPRLSQSYLFFTIQWDTSYQDIALNLNSLDYALHSRSVTPDRSFLQVDAIGYQKADGGSIYAARGTYNLSTFDMTQDIWIQTDDPTEVALPIWPDFIVNPDWGNGTVVRFGNIGLEDGVFQEHFSDNSVIRGSISGETEPIPVVKFTPANHPVLSVPPEVLAYAHPYPTPNHLDPLIFSFIESSSLTILSPLLPNQEWGFIDDGAGSLWGCIYSGDTFSSVRNTLVEPSGYAVVGICINHDSASLVADGSLIYQATVSSWFGNFVWDVTANVSHAITSGSGTTLPISHVVYFNGKVYWWENEAGVSGASTASSIDNTLWKSRADGSSAASVGTYTVDFPSGYAQTLVNTTWQLGDGLHVTYGPSGWGYSRVVPTSLVITAGSVVGTDDGAGNITGTGIVSGSINYTTGFISIHYVVAPSLGTPISVQGQSTWITGDTWQIVPATGNNSGTVVSSGGVATIQVTVQNTVTGANIQGILDLPITGATNTTAANLLSNVSGEWGAGIPTPLGAIRVSNANYGEAPLWQRLDSGGATAPFNALWPNTGTWAIGSVANTSLSLDLSHASAYDGSSVLIVNPLSGSFGASPASLYTMVPVGSGPLSGLTPNLLFLAT